MGNWNITINGVGQHHNGQPRDVERLAAEFVERLRANGHTVTVAGVTTGSAVDISLGTNPAKTLYPNTYNAAPAGAPVPPGYVPPKSDGKIYGQGGPGFGDGAAGS